MKKISTFMLLVCVLWYSAATSGNITAIIATIIITLTAFPIWAFVVAKKIGRNPWKWVLLSILLPLVGPLVLAITAREDIAAAQHKEMVEGKKGFWESRFGKFGELIPYVAVLLFVLALVGLQKLGSSPGVSSMDRDPQTTPQLPSEPENSTSAPIPPQPSTSASIPPQPPTSASIPPQPPSPTQFQQSTNTPNPAAFERSKPDIPFSKKAVWPDYLPKDIPPVPANIVWVWADAITIRIQFNNLAPKDFSAYLDLMKSNGFSLEYVIYKHPGEVLSEADQKRLFKEGKFDGVRMRKDKYNFYIEYGANEGTYDLNAKDFLDASKIHP